MDLQELIEHAKNYVLTEEDIKAFQERSRIANEKLALDVKRSEVTLEWLNKSFANL